jgi:thiamine-monophosphate kinase
VPLKEKALLHRIRRAAARRSKGIGVGIGDDCAVLRLPRGHEALITTDFSLEGVHFRRDWHPADAIGHRCLTRGLSDIAAMGGIPQAAFLSLALPADLPQKWVDQFISGLLKLADRYSVLLAGGDTAQSPQGIMADIVVLGSVPSGKAILRSGAKLGDLIYVTGNLGSSHDALTQLRNGKHLRPQSHLKHFYPEPRIAIGQLLREKKLASAMIDISDGLSTDLAHICEESKVGAVLHADALAAVVHRDAVGRTTLNASATRRRQRLVSGHDFSRAERRPSMIGALAPAALEPVLHGGDEYELVFTAARDRRIPGHIAGVSITRIGEIVRGNNMKLVVNGKSKLLKPRGWEHFR